MNAPESEKKSPHLTRGKRFIFSALLVVFGVGVSLSAGEYFLRYRSQKIAQSNYFDPGHIVYDSLLGWKLAQNWKGRHTHYDFEVSYSTNRFGFRGEFPQTKARGTKRYAFVGDSFTFSYGANDEDTFINILNEMSGGKRQYLNFGLPGTSTDQQLLLIKDRVLLFDPDVVVLVVYLGNDLFDNLLSFPLQADRAKPFFEIEGQRLALKNVPVPVTTKPPREQAASRQKIGLDAVTQRVGWTGILSSQFEIARLLLDHLGHGRQAGAPDFRMHFKDALNLFYKIVDEIKSVCSENGVALQIVLMPGQSFVISPGSLSAPVQDFFRQEILANRSRWGVPIHDLAGHLRNEYERTGEMLYHPHEGHLNKRGHQVVVKGVKSALDASPSLQR